MSKCSGPSWSRNWSDSSSEVWHGLYPLWPSVCQHYTKAPFFFVNAYHSCLKRARQVVIFKGARGAAHYPCLLDVRSSAKSVRFIPQDDILVSGVGIYCMAWPTLRRLLPKSEPFVQFSLWLNSSINLPITVVLGDQTHSWSWKKIAVYTTLSYTKELQLSFEAFVIHFKFPKYQEKSPCDEDSPEWFWQLGEPVVSLPRYTYQCTVAVRFNIVSIERRSSLYELVPHYHSIMATQPTTLQRNHFVALLRTCLVCSIDAHSS